MDLRTLAEAIAWICTRSLEAVDEIAKVSAGVRLTAVVTGVRCMAAAGCGAIRRPGRRTATSNCP